jgi:hypothetical protein
MRNVLNALVLLLLPVYASILGLLLIGLFQWLSGIMHKSNELKPFWQPFIDVTQAFNRPSAGRGWVVDLFSILSLAAPIFVVWLLPFSSVPTMAEQGDLLVILFGLFGTTLFSQILCNLVLTKKGEPYSYLVVYLNDLVFALSAFASMAIVASLKLSDITSAQWLSQASEQTGMWSFSDWFIIRAPLAASMGILSLAISFLIGSKALDKLQMNASDSEKYYGMALLAHSVNIFDRIILFCFLFLGSGSLIIATAKALLVFVAVAIVGLIFSYVRSDKTLILIAVVASVLAFAGLVLSTI